MVFVYDESGAPIAIHYRLNGSAENVFYTYYLEKNLQGDIIALYNASGTKYVGYTYDAWGNCTTTYYNGGGSTGAQFNPFRYRGYYYDSDLGLYYLNSRYYDPNTGRFINADQYISNVGGNLIGNNLYIYCFNNPVCAIDSKGNWPRWITATIAVVAGVVAMVASATIVVTVAATVAVVSTVAYVAQSHHYDKRKEKNTDLPQTPQEAKDSGWRGPDTIPQGPAADCHQYTSPDKSNVKYVSSDGHKEVIYDSNGKIVVDPRDMGTYNFSPSGTFWGDIGHFFSDMVPWVLFGNDDDDPGPLVNEFIRLFE